MKKKIIIACSKKWFLKNNEVKKLLKKKNVILLTSRSRLNEKILNKIDPSIIFFPHWSYKVNQNILSKYNCICFHTAPLPYGRGGSPIQNLIIRNFKKTPVCAIKMTNEIDAGPIYLKKNISLSGNLNQIFERISIQIIDMIKILITKRVKTKSQIGKVYKFRRIKKYESEIKNEKNIEKIYNKIRMLDADNYPKAYIRANKFKVFFKNPILKNNSISCNAEIFISKK